MKKARIIVTYWSKVVVRDGCLYAWNKKQEESDEPQLIRRLNSPVFEFVDAFKKAKNEWRVRTVQYKIEK